MSSSNKLDEVESPSRVMPRPTVLYVDGDPARRALVKEVLRDAGFHVQTAVAAAPAEALAGHQRFCAVLAQYFLPDDLGSELLRRLQDRPQLRDCRFVLVAQAPVHTADMAVVREDPSRPEAFHEALLQNLGSMSRAS